jgi:hypothetical protein
VVPTGAAIAINRFWSKSLWSNRTAAVAGFHRPLMLAPNTPSNANRNPGALFIVDAYVDTLIDSFDYLDDQDLGELQILFRFLNWHRRRDRSLSIF